MQNTLLDNPLMVSSVADEAEEETTYNIIADPEQSRQTQSLFGGAGADDSGAPDLGKMTSGALQAQFEDDPYLQQTFGTFDNYMAYMDERLAICWASRTGGTTRVETLEQQQTALR